MKLSTSLVICIAAMSLTASTASTASTAFAANERPCTAEVLTCRLDQKLISGGRVFLAEQTEKFSGINDDEPSIQPDECKINLWMQKDDLAFSVQIGDSDYMSSVYAQSRSNLGRILPGSVAFPVINGKSFYYEYNNLLLICILK